MPRTLQLQTPKWGSKTPHFSARRRCKNIRKEEPLLRSCISQNKLPINSDIAYNIIDRDRFLCFKSNGYFFLLFLNDLCTIGRDTEGSRGSRKRRRRKKRRPLTTSTATVTLPYDPNQGSITTHGNCRQSPDKYSY
jgi:hypothetical protein